MMSIYDILNSTPVKDTVTIRFNRPDLPGHIDEVHNVTEEQVRWLQYNIAKGNYPYNAACIMSSSGKKSFFAPDGRLTNPVYDSNIMSLNDDLAMGILFAKANVPCKF